MAAAAAAAAAAVAEAAVAAAAMPTAAQWLQWHQPAEAAAAQSRSRNHISQSQSLPHDSKNKPRRSQQPESDERLHQFKVLVKF